MLSKLTFSLALVLMLAFLATSAMAQTTDYFNAAVAEGGFGIVGRTATPPGVLATPADAVPDAVTGANLPNLADHLRFGGTIELQLRLASDNDAAAAAKGASASATTDEKTKSMWQKAIISEIMWGLDSPTDTNTSDAVAQWIEVYNHAAGAIVALADNTATGNGLRLVYYTGRNTTGADVAIETDFNGPEGSGTTPLVDTLVDDNTNGIDDDAVWVLVDRVSTVDRFGAFWAPKGQSGNTVITPNIDRAADTLTDLISMYRNATVDKDGKKYMTNKDSKAIEGLGDGTAGGSWLASVGRANMMGRNYVGSPGSVHVGAGGGTKAFAKLPASIPGTSIVINEVRNDSSDANLDWVELYNNSASTSVAINIDGYELNMVTRGAQTDAQKAAGTYPDPAEAELVDFPVHKMAPGEYLVIYNRHPGNTILAGGVNIEDVPVRRQVNKGASHSYLVRTTLDLPSDKGKFLLILRTATDKNDTGEAVADFAGNGFFPRVKLNEFDTDTYPFVAWPVPAAEDVGDNSFASRTQSWGRIATLSDTGSYVPHPAAPRDNDRFHGDDWQAFDGTQGGVGYDRDVDLNNAPGTPGYANIVPGLLSDDRDSALDANKAAKGSYIFGGTVTISEVMYDAGPRWNLVQWIELYNSSLTEAIDIGGWDLEIRNKEDVESYVDSSFELRRGYNDSAESDVAYRFRHRCE